jgi:hypothetical protein
MLLEWIFAVRLAATAEDYSGSLRMKCRHNEHEDDIRDLIRRSG